MLTRTLLHSSLGSPDIHLPTLYTVLASPLVASGSIDRSRLVIRSNILYRTWISADGASSTLQLIIPRALRHDVMNELHNNSGHSGVNNTQDHLPLLLAVPKN